MALSINNLSVVLRLCRAGILGKKFHVADIGAQQIGNDVLRDHMLMLAFGGAFGVQPRCFGTPTRRDKTLPPDASFASQLWEWLGCPYVAIDIDGSPGSIPLDLNFDEVPRKHRGRYQLVMNLGTTEHVANQNHAMKVIHDLTAVGGVMIHDVPTQGYGNHGLISYNPKFFWMLSRGCRYHWLDMRLSFDALDSPFPADVIGEVTRFDARSADRLKSRRLTDTSFTAVLQKREDLPFVPPIDMPTASVATNRRFRSRYWAAPNNPGT
jgi:hypothetical protein